MKKYFAKYLPIEGEIKEGDTFIITDPRIQDHPSGLIRTCYHITKNQVCWSEKNQNWTSEECDFLYIDPLESEFWGFVERHHAKKSKLFLCTKNVNIGDNTIDGIIKKEKLNDFIFENGKCLQKSLCFKIIGEISPEAIWVKEGDEFEQDEILQKSKTIMMEERVWLYNEEDNSSKELTLEELLELELEEDSNIHSYKIGSRYKWKDAEDEAEVTYYYNQYQIKCLTCKKFH